MHRHDLAAFVACFDADYDSEQPAHPDRRFRSREQVERYWSAMFAGLPDFRADLLRSAVAGDTVWAEWRWQGTRADGTTLDARGRTGARDRHEAPWRGRGDPSAVDTPETLAGERCWA